MGQIWLWREEELDSLTHEARSALVEGKIIALPTETYYALAVHPFKEEALSRLFTLKERPPGKPVLLLVAHREMLGQVVKEIPEAGDRLMNRFWPGPLTIIFPALPHLPRLLTAGDTVGVRQPNQPVTCRLITALGFPVTGTSANRSGRAPLTRAAAVVQEFGEEVALVLDTGPTPGGLPSTIVDVTCSPPRLVRAGGIGASLIHEVIPEINQG